MRSLRKMTLVLSLTAALSGCVFLDDSFHKKSLSTLILTKEHNPSLRREYRATIDQKTRQIALDLPNYADSTKLVIDLEWEGRKVSFNGHELIPGVSTIDLSLEGQLRIWGLDNTSQDFTLNTTQVPPLATTDFLAMGFWSTFLGENISPLSSQCSPFRDFAISWPSAQSCLLTTLWKVRPWPYRNHLYFEFQNQAIAVRCGSLVLTDGLVGGAGFQYSPNNWIDFSNPVTLTLVAEDLSTRDVTLTLADHL